MAKGMGFKAAAASVAKKSGMPMKQAQAAIAAGARKASPAAKKANPNLKKVTGKKAPPFKKMSDAVTMDAAACPPGSMSNMSVKPGLGAAPKAKKAAKKAPAAMAEVGVMKTPRQRKSEVATTARSARQRVKPTGKKPASQARIPAGGGTASTTGSRTY